VDVRKDEEGLGTRIGGWVSFDDTLQLILRKVQVSFFKVDAGQFRAGGDRGCR